MCAPGSFLPVVSVPKGENKKEKEKREKRKEKREKRKEKREKKREKKYLPSTV